MDRTHRGPAGPEEDRDPARPRSPAAPGQHPGGARRDGLERGGHLDASLIADVQRRAGNAAATSLVAARAARTARGDARPSVQRDRPRRGTRSGAPASMTRAEFEAECAAKGVGQVATGTLDQQVTRLNAFSAADRVGDALRADVEAGRQRWESWDPGGSSPVYRAILSGLDDFATAMGGLPPIRQLLFFKRGYVGVRVSGEMRTGWDPAGADYSGGVMTVYENAVLQATAKVLPTRRDTASGQAPADRPTEAQGIGRVITHELGHGLQEVAHDPAAVSRAAGPLMMDRYARDIGWRRDAAGGGRWHLYDVGDPDVQAAFAAGRAPDARLEITPDTWQRGWHEQPISRYQVSQGPFEDFPEAVMAYVANRNLLQQRSPARHDFVRSVISELAGRLGTPSSGSGRGS